MNGYYRTVVTLSGPVMSYDISSANICTSDQLTLWTSVMYSCVSQVKAREGLMDEQMKTALYVC